ncbi:MAG: hypothetical protein KJO12_10710 [Ignavibacteria bacterium]|nr:hypothetical protein [Ignavibacteria bacterium]
MDCTAFDEGGTILLKILTGKGSCAGSFDLFPQGFPLPSKGKPEGTLDGDYDVTTNAKGEIEYKFDKGQIFQFGATGNWFSRKDQTNTYTFEITVNYDYDHEHLGTIVLTKSNPKGSGSGTLIAPGRNRQAYKLFTIDTRNFANGGTLKILVKLSKDGCLSSFDLFPDGIIIPFKGKPIGTLVGAYNKGHGAILEYKFESGRVFQFGATGSWDARKGSTNDFEFTAEIITK